MQLWLKIHGCTMTENVLRFATEIKVKFVAIAGHIKAKINIVL